MKSRKAALPGGKPGSAKAYVQNKRRWLKNNRVGASAQGSISFRDGNRIAATVVLAGNRAILFVAGENGMRQVGGILDVGGAE